MKEENNLLEFLVAARVRRRCLPVGHAVDAVEVRERARVRRDAVAARAERRWLDTLHMFIRVDRPLRRVAPEHGIVRLAHARPLLHAAAAPLLRLRLRAPLEVGARQHDRLVRLLYLPLDGRAALLEALRLSRQLQLDLQLHRQFHISIEQMQ